MGLHAERHIETDGDSPPAGQRACEILKDALREAARAARKRAPKSKPAWESLLAAELAAEPARPEPSHGAPRRLLTKKVRPDGCPPMVVVLAIDEERERVYVLHAYPERLLTTRSDRQVAHDRAVERLRDYYPGWRSDPERNP